VVDLPEMTVRNALVELAHVLPRLAAVLECQSEARDRVEPLAYRIDQVAAALGVSRRTLERALSAGKFPLSPATTRTLDKRLKTQSTGTRHSRLTSALQSFLVVA
jgi:AraC-like DNA-binding protein